MTAPHATSVNATPDFSAALPRLRNEAETPSPALLVFPDRVAANLRRMLALVAGDASRLRPHIKTTKLPQVVALLTDAGITKVKTATIAESEMAAAAGAREVLLALQLVGPNVARFLALQRSFPAVSFSTVVDNAATAAALAAAAVAAGQVVDVLLDLDVGQHRTGIAPGAAARELYRRLATTPGLRAAGLHAYDGHLQVTDRAERAAGADAAFATVADLRAALVAEGLAVPRIVCGGTPTFPLHATRADVECSPGTCVFWDAGYATKLPDLQFEHAAVLLTRVISRPAENRLCLDLGHKAVASEMPHPRVIFPALPEARAVIHSEEHLVIETPRASEFPIGTVVYGLPWHICPTVALHDRVAVVRGDRIVEQWTVTARARRLEI